MRKTDDTLQNNCKSYFCSNKVCTETGMLIGSKVKFTDFAVKEYKLKENNELSVIGITDNKEGGKVAILSNNERFCTFWLKLSSK